MRPLSAIAEAVESHESYILTIGDRREPLLGSLCEMGLPSYAYCNAVLASRGERSLRARCADRAVRSLDTCLTRLENEETDPEHEVTRVGRYWTPETLKTFLLLWDLDTPQVTDWSKRIAAVNSDVTFPAHRAYQRPWWWLCAEWLRYREGLSPYTLEQLDHWLAVLNSDAGIQDIGAISDCFHLADLLAERYDGRLKLEFGMRMEALLLSVVSLQLGDESLVSVNADSNHFVSAAEQCAYFTHATTYFRKRNPEHSQTAAEAARRAYAAYLRVQSSYQPKSMCEDDAATTCGTRHALAPSNGIIAASFLAAAVWNGFDNSESA